jgi:hypothetical protein
MGERVLELGLADEDGSVGDLASVPVEGSITMLPTSLEFIVVDAASASACDPS